MRKRKAMISTMGFGLALVLVCGMAMAKTSRHDDDCADEKSATVSGQHESPFACDRLALDPEARKRHFDELGPALRSLRKAVASCRMDMNSSSQAIRKPSRWWRSGWRPSASAVRSLTYKCAWNEKVDRSGCD